MEPELYSSVPEIVIREKHNENCITVQVPRRTQKIELSPIYEDSSLVFFCTDLGNIFDGDVGDDKGILMRSKGPHAPKFAYGFVRSHSLMFYTDIVESNPIGGTKAPLSCCFPLISKLKSGDVINTGQYKNYQIFSKFQFRRLLKNSFQSIHIDLRDTSGETIPLVSVGIPRLVLMFRRKVSDFLY